MKGFCIINKNICYIIVYYSNNSMRFSNNKMYSSQGKDRPRIRCLVVQSAASLGVAMHQVDVASQFLSHHISSPALHVSLESIVLGNRECRQSSLHLYTAVERVLIWVRLSNERPIDKGRFSRMLPSTAVSLRDLGHTNRERELEM